MEYAVEVSTDSTGKFYGNALKFATAEAAEIYAKDLFCRWTSVKEWRVVQIIPKGWEVLRIPVQKAA